VTGDTQTHDTNSRYRFSVSRPSEVQT